MQEEIMTNIEILAVGTASPPGLVPGLAESRFQACDLPPVIPQALSQPPEAALPTASHTGQPVYAPVSPSAREPGTKDTCFPRKTKIIATLGPATEKPDTLRALILAGVNVFRLNMSHSKHDWAARLIYALRSVSTELNRPVAVMLDTQGPSIRTGDLPAKLNLKPGDTFTFLARGEKSEEVFSVDTNYDDLMQDIKVGDVVLVDNGVIQMTVKEKTDHRLKCEILTAGTLGSRRHINLPGVKVHLPGITEKDWADIEFGLENGVDWIALSFVREAADVQQLRERLAAKGKAHLSIIAKIEDQSAVENIDAIIAAADGIMVARGDLGIECPYEELPIIQRRIVKKCVAAMKPVIVATHLLESMIQNPLPTRAEITDVANAVYEQADAVMLSGETTVGQYPLKCVEVLDRVARRLELSGSIGFHDQIILGSERENMVASGVHMANQIRADGIVVFTRRGHLANIAAALRPRWSPVFVFTPDARLARRLALRYALHPLVLPFAAQPKETIHAAEAMLLERQLLPRGARLVLVSDILDENQQISSVQLRVLGEPH